MTSVSGELTNFTKKSWIRDNEERMLFVLTLGKKMPIEISVWDAALVKGIKIGDKLRVTYVQMENYKNATKIEIIGKGEIHNIEDEQEDEVEKEEKNDEEPEEVEKNV